MALSMYSALILANNDDLRVETVESEGKHGFCITTGEHHRPVVSSSVTFDSQDAASTVGQLFLDECREKYGIRLEDFEINEGQGG